MIFVQIHFGWGKSKSLIADEDWDSLEKVSDHDQDAVLFLTSQAVYSADILYIAVLSSSKASTALFYRTITLRSSQWMSYALLAVTLLCAPVTMVLLSVRCGLHPWHDINKQCSVLVGHSILQYHMFVHSYSLVPSLAGCHSIGYHFRIYAITLPYPGNHATSDDNKQQSHCNSGS